MRVDSESLYESFLSIDTIVWGVRRYAGAVLYKES